MHCLYPPKLPPLNNPFPRSPTPRTAPKKVSAVTFTADPAVVLAADKFGDVLAGPATAAAAAAVVAPPPATTARSDTAPPPPPPGLHLMFAHFCTIVTSMAPSTTGPPAVVTTDRDGKVRVTDVPPDVAAAATPGTLTAPTIRAMCIGHTAFASSATWCGSRPDGGRLIASGGGDGAVRLWCVDGDAAGGPPLATHATSPAAAAHAAARADARAKVAAAVAARRAEKAVTAAACPGALARPAAPAGGGGDDDDGEGSEADAEGLFLPTRLPPPPAVIAVASTPPSLPASIIAIVEGEAGVARVLTVDATAGTLTRSDDLPLPGVDAPAALAVDAAGRVWAAGAAAAGLQVAAVVLPGSGAIGVPAAALAALTAAADGGGDEGAAGCQVSPEIRRGMAAPVKEAVAVA